jgi:hypothetical protein
LIVSRGGRPIESLEEWRDLAPPASPGHWVDGRSAKCLAEAWIEGNTRTDLVELLGTSSCLARFEIGSATPEAQTSFDRFRGGRRNHDLLIQGSSFGGTTVVGVEAKADEAFGLTLSGYRDVARARCARGERSNAEERLNGLTEALLGRVLERDPDIGALRYQLFTGVAGVLVAAGEQQAGQAVFLVHEFVTPRTDRRLRRRNLEDLRSFLTTGLNRQAPDGESWLEGPIRVTGGDLIPADVPLWIGHLRTIFNDADPARN